MTKLTNSVTGFLLPLSTIALKPTNPSKSGCSPGVGGRVPPCAAPLPPRADLASRKRDLGDSWDLVGKVERQIVDDLNELDWILSSDEVSQEEAAQAKSLVDEINVLMTAQAFKKFDAAANAYLGAVEAAPDLSQRKGMAEAVATVKNTLQQLRTAHDAFLKHVQDTLAGKTKFADPQGALDPEKNLGQKALRFQSAIAALSTAQSRDPSEQDKAAR